MNKKTLSSFFATILALLAAWGIYTPKPNPSPTPSPTATATATATVSPSPSPFPTLLPTPPPPPSCSLPPSSGKCEDNPSAVSIYLNAVQSVQLALADEAVFVDKQGKVVNEGAYTQEVVRRLQLNGYCADSKLADEVVVKKDNNLSETFDLVTGSGDTWIKFVYRCVPAGF